MDPNPERKRIELAIGDEVEYEGHVYTVRRVSIDAQEYVDTIDVRRGNLRVNVSASYGPPRAEDQLPYPEF